MKAKTFIVGFFVCVAVIAAVSLYIGTTIDKPAKSVTALVSPDGRLKAVKVTLAGGGASPYCFDSVSVMLAAYPDEFAEREKAYEVYASPCAKLADGAPSPKLEWLSASALQITAVPPVKTTRKKNIDVTKSVHVTFVERQ